MFGTKGSNNIKLETQFVPSGKQHESSIFCVLEQNALNSYFPETELLNKIRNFNSLQLKQFQIKMSM